MKTYVPMTYGYNTNYAWLDIRIYVECMKKYMKKKKDESKKK